jgi:hypothetical protein
MRNRQIMLFLIKHENFVKKSSKYALVRVKTYNLSARIIFVHSQTRVTISLSAATLSAGDPADPGEVKKSKWFIFFSTV